MVEEEVLCRSCGKNIASQIREAKEAKGEAQKQGSCPYCGQTFHLKWKGTGHGALSLRGITFPGLSGNNCSKRERKRNGARPKNDGPARKERAGEQTMRRDPRGNHNVLLPKVR